jgi:imidazolonepropionase-like amidohydrolase
MPPEMLAKNDLVIEGGLRSLEICKRAGVPVAYGTDLLGQLQVDQSREFRLRSQVLSPLEIIRSATLVGARVLRQEGKLGCLRPGALADLIVVDGDPLQDLALLEKPDRSVLAIMKGGRFHRNRFH